LSTLKNGMIKSLLFHDQWGMIKSLLFHDQWGMGAKIMLLGTKKM